MMKSWIPSETVVFKLVGKSTGETTGDLKPITDEKIVTVDNCVIYDSSFSKIGEGFMYHDRIRKIIHLPKEFTADVRGAKVIVDGVEYKVTDATDPYKKSPLRQNRHAVCEAVK